MFGVLAITARPNNYMTGTNGQTYQSFQDQSDSYHRDATISTVGLAVGGAFVAVSAVLFFARTKDPSDGSSGAAATAAAALDPLVNGIRF